MTSDQEHAFEFLKELLHKHAPRHQSVHACLEGWAGTGKTWLVGHWLQWVSEHYPEMRILVTAPTNKAVDVLRGKCGHIKADFRTLDSYLGYRMQRDDDHELQRVKVGKASEYDLVVPDEASMVKLAMHRELMAQRVILLYVGDPAQLQPIGEETSAAFDTPLKAVLREPTRQAADSPIHALADYFRQRVDDKGIFTLDDVRHVLPKDPRITFTRSLAVLDWYETALDKGLDARMLAFDNVTVYKNNTAMHGRRFPDAPLFGRGEIALVNETYELGNDDLLCNGQLLTVHDCVPADDIAGLPMYDVQVTNPAPALEVDGETVQRTPLVLKVAGDWAQAEAKRKSLTDQIWRARTAGDMDTVERLVDIRRPLHKLAPLRHSYSSTVHKAQGSTHDVTFLDWASIYRSRDMRARLMYVGATRPSQFLVVATN